MKAKRKRTKAQANALQRNSHKGLVACMLKHAEGMKKSPRLTFAEQMKILKCKTILKEILSAWEPTI